jgi:hypothetical protein
MDAPTHFPQPGIATIVKIDAFGKPNIRKELQWDTMGVNKPR